MKTEEKLGSVKRFGARYGRKPKLKFSKIETEQRKLHKCPYCHKQVKSLEDHIHDEHKGEKVINKK